MSHVKEFFHAREVYAEHEYRVLAILLPANNRYVERLMVFAVPGGTDANVELYGCLTIPVDPAINVVDWIETHPEHRRTGIARRLWEEAEKILGRKIDHMPVTPDGEAFANAMEPPASAACGMEETK